MFAVKILIARIEEYAHDLKAGNIGAVIGILIKKIQYALQASFLRQLKAHFGIKVSVREAVRLIKDIELGIKVGIKRADGNSGLGRDHFDRNIIDVVLHQ